MISLDFPPLRSVVCVGAHPDDIEIGAAATISWLAERDPMTTFTFVVLSGGDGARRDEAKQSARALLGDRVHIDIGQFRDGHLPYEDPSAVKDFLRERTEQERTDLVIGPNRLDRHQDHAFTAQLLGQIFRDQLILGYEVAKFDGDLGAPQGYVSFDVDRAQAKLDHLMKHFSSQHDKPWFDREAFMSLMRLRGIESGSPRTYAESFYVSKVLLG